MDLLLNCIIILICVIIIYLICTTFSIIGNLLLEIKKIKINEFSSNINSKIDEKTFELLDKIIEESFSEYIVLNVEYKDIEYVDNKLEKEITTNVSHLVAERLSKTLINKISLVYNVDNLPKLIAEKVYLHTLNYTINKNSLT